jgi:hypothetical protein
MNKVNTILALLGLGLAVSALDAGPASADCLRSMSLVQRRALGAQDWVVRETALAMLTEARREASRGAEAACLVTLEQVRTQLRNARR